MAIKSEAHRHQKPQSSPRRDYPPLYKTSTMIFAVIARSNTNLLQPMPVLLSEYHAIVLESPLINLRILYERRIHSSCNTRAYYNAIEVRKRSSRTRRYVLGLGPEMNFHFGCLGIVRVLEEFSEYSELSRVASKNLVN